MGVIKCALVRKGVVRNKGASSIEFYKNGEPQRYCYGYIDKMTDELFPECEECNVNVNKAQGELEKELDRMLVQREVLNASR